MAFAFEGARLEMLMRPMVKKNSLLLLVVGVIALLVSSCNRSENFVQSGLTQFFLQDYNPEFLDVVWMVDTRSNMSIDQTQKARLISEARNFFVRLDGLTTARYRMGIVSHDVDMTSPGTLLPKNSGVILTKNLGSVDSRAQRFASIFSNTFNLSTSGRNAGLESVRSALLGNSTTNTAATFTSDPAIPLVLVFITDSDDRSDLPSGVAAPGVDYFASQYLSTKNSSSLLKAYAVNYKTTGARCYTQSNADIDVTSGPYAFQDRYFKLVDKIGGDKVDICGSWSNAIDLTGLKLKDLPKRFKLDKAASPDSFTVLIFDKNQTYTGYDFTFDASTNEIVFTVAPPAGTTIQVTYHSL